VSTVTEKEAKFLLRSLPSMIPSAPQVVLLWVTLICYQEPQHSNDKRKSNKSRADDRTEQFIQDLMLHKKQLEVMRNQKSCDL
jgi:hypothetical protein